ncbi:hypothetical protein HK098_003945 [Nowakowskiella sp. JEL0407]|nr:hypothetical protein HK098_003945 [Nowakowskiella sp. JEL0407]
MGREYSCWANTDVGQRPTGPEVIVELTVKEEEGKGLVRSYKNILHASGKRNSNMRRSEAIQPANTIIEFGLVICGKSGYWATVRGLGSKWRLVK